MSSTRTRSNVTPAADRPDGAPWELPAAAAFLSVSARHLQRQIAAGRLRSVTIGRRRLVPDAEVQRLAREGC
jgi:excisionase family DNA binding protein